MSEVADNNGSADNGQHIKPKKSAKAKNTKNTTAVTGGNITNTEEVAVTPTKGGGAKPPKTPTRKRAAPAADGASSKKARAVKKTYNPDSYEAFNDDDKALYDLKTHHQDWK